MARTATVRTPPVTRPASAETGITKNRAISELTRSAHGDLAQYVPVGAQAAKDDPLFFGHLIAWDRTNGSIRDSKVALPIVQLSERALDFELRENALAHLALLDPRSLVRAVRFADAQGVRGRWGMLKPLVARYLGEREKSLGWFERTALQHRASMKALYAIFHIKPNATANLVLFRGEPPAGTVFDAVRQLSKMSPREAAGTIMEKRIPFLIAMGALGKRAKEPDLLLALLDRMSPAELITNMKMLEKLGVNEREDTRVALREALKKTASATPAAAAFKATRAADAGGLSEKTAQTLREVQEHQIDKLEGPDGDWLVLGDRSGSMSEAVESARQVAATLARMVAGKVWLVFFNSSPVSFDVTGKSYDEILQLTRLIKAGGGTSIGCGLQLILDKKENIDGIAVVSDGAENEMPLFREAYRIAEEQLGKRPPVYFYAMGPYSTAEGGSSFEEGMRHDGFDLQRFDLRAGADFYSLPNIIATMRSNRYSLIDEIMAAPLLTLESAFAQTRD